MSLFYLRLDALTSTETTVPDDRILIILISGFGRNHFTGVPALCDLLLAFLRRGQQNGSANNPGPALGKEELK